MNIILKLRSLIDLIIIPPITVRCITDRLTALLIFLPLFIKISPSFVVPTYLNQNCLLIPFTRHQWGTGSKSKTEAAANWSIL